MIVGRDADWACAVGPRHHGGAGQGVGKETATGQGPCPKCICPTLSARAEILSCRCGQLGGGSFTGPAGIGPTGQVTFQHGRTRECRGNADWKTVTVVSVAGISTEDGQVVGAREPPIGRVSQVGQIRVDLRLGPGDDHIGRARARDRVARNRGRGRQYTVVNMQADRIQIPVGIRHGNQITSRESHTAARTDGDGCGVIVDGRLIGAGDRKRQGGAGGRPVRVFDFVIENFLYLLVGCQGLQGRKAGCIGCGGQDVGIRPISADGQ